MQSKMILKIIFTLFVSINTYAANTCSDLFSESRDSTSQSSRFVVDPQTRELMVNESIVTGDREVFESVAYAIKYVKGETKHYNSNVDIMTLELLQILIKIKFPFHAKISKGKTLLVSFLYNNGWNYIKEVFAHSNSPKLIMLTDFILASTMPSDLMTLSKEIPNLPWKQLSFNHMKQGIEKHVHDQINKFGSEMKQLHGEEKGSQRQLEFAALIKEEAKQYILTLEKLIGERN